MANFLADYCADCFYVENEEFLEALNDCEDPNTALQCVGINAYIPSYIKAEECENFSKMMQERIINKIKESLINKKLY